MPHLGRLPPISIRSEGYDMTMLDSPSPHLPAVRFFVRRLARASSCFSPSNPAGFFST
ncbi:hypothetical protein C7S14_0686 [Burkholderia cepacia]|nr:hypothetical protein C7S14_0686 [Burkholderia cepacia]